MLLAQFIENLASELSLLSEHLNLTEPHPVSGPAYRQAELVAMTPDQLLDKTRDVYLKETLRFIPEQVAIAKKYGLELVAYEGGPAYDAYFGSENDDKINKLFDEVNRHPRMGELYIEMLKAWKAAGAQTFVNFNSCGRYSKWGRWGLLEYIAQPAADSPKYSSVLKFISDEHSDKH